MEISYTIKRGKNVGAVCEPHKTQAGKFIVSKTRFKEDYIYVDTYDEILDHLKKGFKVRVSEVITKRSPSLVSYDSLTITK
ncbi:MAG: hypothetical protein B0D91_10975 [Oceanospirillales bacterium LUC14_002_19_P2]|nr:MAG: hypothetical protein B0D91_10975 [Oceanospirillales bacterium LUC14_002_19_P2]